RAIMKAVKISKPYTIENVIIPEPNLASPDDVKIKIKRVGICGSDMHIYHGKDNLSSYPIIFGHEITGEVVETSPDTYKLNKGDHVVVEPIKSCGNCYACQNNRPNVCEKISVIGVHEEGGMQEYIVLPEKHIHKVPQSLSWDETVLVEPYSIGAQSLWRGSVRGKQTLLIQGAGSIGTIILRMTKSVSP